MNGEADFEEANKMPHRIMFACNEENGSVVASGDLNRLGAVIVQALAKDERMYKFFFKVVNDAMSVRSKAKKQGGQPPPQNG